MCIRDRLHTTIEKLFILALQASQLTVRSEIYHISYSGVQQCYFGFVTVYAYNLQKSMSFTVLSSSRTGLPVILPQIFLLVSNIVRNVILLSVVGCSTC